MKTFLAFLLLATAAFGQNWGQAVNQVNMGPIYGAQRLYFYNGSNLIQYTCIAPQVVRPTNVSIAAATLTNIVVTGNTTATVTTASGHGLYIGARVNVVDTQTATLAGNFTVLTVPSTTTYTFTVPSTTNATYTDASLLITTTNPLTSLGVWELWVNTYNGSSLLTSSYWASNTVATQQPNAMLDNTIVCDNRANY